jgi:hypothetical protein
LQREPANTKSLLRRVVKGLVTLSEVARIGDEAVTHA